MVPVEETREEYEDCPENGTETKNDRIEHWLSHFLPVEVQMWEREIR